MKYLSSLIFGISLSFLISSCDPGVVYNKIIQNSSDHSLKVYVYPDSTARWSGSFVADSFLIEPHSEVSIAEVTAIGSVSEFRRCETFSDSIVVKIADNDSLNLNLDLTHSGFWSFMRLSRTFRRGGRCACRVIITNGNIN